MGQCDEAQLYFWVLGIHVCHRRACGCWETRARCTCLLHGNLVGWDPRSGPRPELFLGKKQRDKTGQEKQFCPTCSVLADPFPSASCPSRNLTAPKPEPSAFFMLCCGPDPREGLDALSCRCSEFSQVTLLRCWWLLFFFLMKKKHFSICFSIKRNH